jgi:hypothetical protein
VAFRSVRARAGRAWAGRAWGPLRHRSTPKRRGEVARWRHMSWGWWVMYRAERCVGGARLGNRHDCPPAAAPTTAAPAGAGWNAINTDTQRGLVYREARDCGMGGAKRGGDHGAAARGHADSECSRLFSGWAYDDCYTASVTSRDGGRRDGREQGRGRLLSFGICRGIPESFSALALVLLLSCSPFCCSCSWLVLVCWLSFAARQRAACLFLGPIPTVYVNAQTPSRDVGRRRNPPCRAGRP